MSDYGLVLSSMMETSVRVVNHDLDHISDHISAPIESLFRSQFLDMLIIS